MHYCSISFVASRHLHLSLSHPLFNSTEQLMLAWTLFDIQNRLPWSDEIAVTVVS